MVFMMINVGEFKGLIIQQALEGKLTRKLNAEDSKIYLLNNSINYSKYGPYDLPEKWYWVKCKDVCKLLGGFAFKSDNYTDSKDAVRVIRISDFNNDKLLDDEIKKYPYSNVLDAYEIFENDILMCMTGGTVGKTCLFPKLSYRCFLNQRVALFRTEHLEINYLYYVLKSQNILKIINDTKRSTNDNISMKIIGEFDIPFPPLEEQKRIVAKLDEIFAELDKIDEKQTRLANIQEKMEAKILKVAIQGKLVEQRPEEGTGEELFKHIQLEKQELIKQGKIKKEKPLPAIEDVEIPFAIPSTWKWVRLGDLGNYKKGPFGSSLTKSMFVPKSEDSIKVYEQKNAIQKNWNIGTYYIEKKYYESDMKGFTLLPGDIIVSCAGTIGETYVIPNEAEIGIINQALMRMRIMKSVNIDYFLIYFDFILKGAANDKGKGTAIKNIPPFDILKNMLVPLPPFEEQKRIVEKIEELLPLCRSN